MLYSVHSHPKRRLTFLQVVRRVAMYCDQRDSHHTLSPLAQNHRTHRIQAPLTYPQSSHNYPTPYLHNLISIQRPRNTRSSSVVTLARPPASSYLKITDRSFRYASPCLWNQLYLSLVNLIPVPVPPFPTHLFLHPSLFPFLIHHSAHP